MVDAGGGEDEGSDEPAEVRMRKGRAGGVDRPEDRCVGGREAVEERRDAARVRDGGGDLPWVRVTKPSTNVGRE